MSYINSTPFIIERDREIETDEGNYDAWEQYEVYMTHYHYVPPSGRCLQKCVTPDEAFGEEEYEYVIVDSWGEEVIMELTGDEEQDFLKFFFKQMAD